MKVGLTTTLRTCSSCRTAAKVLKELYEKSQGTWEVEHTDLLTRTGEEAERLREEYGLPWRITPTISLEGTLSKMESRYGALSTPLITVNGKVVSLSSFKILRQKALETEVSKHLKRVKHHGKKS